MSKKVQATIACPKCQKESVFSLFRTLWIEIEENRNLLFSDKINFFICPRCGHEERLEFPFLCTNVKKHFAVWYEPYPDEQIDIDIAGYKKHMGVNSYLAKASRVKDWNEFKEAILELEKQTHPSHVTTSKPLSFAFYSFIQHLGRRLGVSSGPEFPIHDSLKQKAFEPQMARPSNHLSPETVKNNDMGERLWMFCKQYSESFSKKLIAAGEDQGAVFSEADRCRIMAESMMLSLWLVSRCIPDKEIILDDLHKRYLLSVKRALEHVEDKKKKFLEIQKELQNIYTIYYASWKEGDKSDFVDDFTITVLNRIFLNPRKSFNAFYIMLVKTHVLSMIKTVHGMQEQVVGENSDNELVNNKQCDVGLSPMAQAILNVIEQVSLAYGDNFYGDAFKIHTNDLQHCFGPRYQIIKKLNFVSECSLIGYCTVVGVMLITRGSFLNSTIHKEVERRFFVKTQEDFDLARAFIDLIEGKLTSQDPVHMKIARIEQMQKLSNTAILYSRRVYSKECSPLLLLYEATYFHKKLIQIPSFASYFEKIADSNVALSAKLIHALK